MVFWRRRMFTSPEFRFISGFRHVYLKNVQLVEDEKRDILNRRKSFCKSAYRKSQDNLLQV